MFTSGASSSTLNTARSAVSFFCYFELDIKNDPAILCLFQYFYKERPLSVKYYTHWPVKKLLDYIFTFHPPGSLSLNDLTLKTLALIALTSSDRTQSLLLMDIDQMHKHDSGITFVIFNRLKHTRKVHKPNEILCVKSDIEELDVSAYVQTYLEKKRASVPILLTELPVNIDIPNCSYLGLRSH